MLSNDASVLAFCSTDLGPIFGDNVGNKLEVLMKGKGHHEHEFAYDIVRIRSLMIYSNLVEYNIVGDTKRSLALTLSLYLNAKGRRHNNWIVHELSDIQ